MEDILETIQNEIDSGKLVKTINGWVIKTDPEKKEVKYGT